MIRDIQKKIKNKGAKRIIENIFSLSVLNVINYVFPIILIPYLTRTFGVNNYGIYAFGFAVINYFTIVVKYGFEFSATKQVAIVRDNKKELEELFSAILTLRVLFIILAVFIMILIVNIFEKLYIEKQLLYSGIGVFSGIALMPIWFFQGMENMRLITIVNFLVRLVTLLLIFLFVRTSEDYTLAMLFQSVGYLFGGILSVILSFKIFRINFIFSSFKKLKEQFILGWYLFLSTIGMSFFRESNTIILGIVADYKVVGYYAAAEKLIKVLQSVTSPIVNALYPYFGRSLNQASIKTEKIESFKKLGVLYILLLTVLTIGVFISAPFVVKKYLSSEYAHSIPNIRLLCVVILFGGMNYYYGILGLVNLGKEKLFTFSVWIAGLINLISCYYLSIHFADKGASVAMSLTEFILFIQIVWYFIVYQRKRSVITNK